jgi:hypothetical protein
MRPVLSLLVLCLACDAPHEDPPGEDLPSLPGAVTVTVTEAGATIAATAQDGATTLTLVVPPGAVDRPIDISLTPSVDGTGAPAFLVSPAGFVPSAAITARLETPLPLEGQGLVWQDDGGEVLLGGAVDGGAIEASLASLGFAPPPSTLRASGGGALTVAPLACDERVDDARIALGVTALRGTPDAVAREGTELLALEATCAQERVAALEQAACDRYLAVETAASAIAVDDDATFASVVGALIQARLAVELTGATCATGGFDALLDAKLSQHLTFLDARWRATSLATDIADELAAIERKTAYQAVCNLLGADDAVCSAVTERMLPDLTDRIRDAAWAECRATGRPSALAEMLDFVQGDAAPAVERPWSTHARFSVGDLERDAGLCGADIEAHVFDAVPIERTGEMRTLRQPAAGQAIDTPDIYVPADGSLVFQGTWTAPPCAVSAADNDRLVARVAGKEVGHADRSGAAYLLPGGLDLSAATLAAAAGIPAQDGGAFDVVLSREGGACPTYHWPADLVTVHVVLGTPVASVALMGGPERTRVFERVAAGFDCAGDSEVYDTHEVRLDADVTAPATQTAGTTSLSLDRGAPGARVTVTTGISPASATFPCPNGDIVSVRSLATVHAHILITPTQDGTLRITSDDPVYAPYVVQARVYDDLSAAPLRDEVLLTSGSLDFHVGEQIVISDTVGFSGERPTESTPASFVPYTFSLVLSPAP